MLRKGKAMHAYLALTTATARIGTERYKGILLLLPCQVTDVDFYAHGDTICNVTVQAEIGGEFSCPMHVQADNVYVSESRGYDLSGTPGGHNGMVEVQESPMSMLELVRMYERQREINSQLGG